MGKSFETDIDFDEAELLDVAHQTDDIDFGDDELSESNREELSMDNQFNREDQFNRNDKSTEKSDVSTSDEEESEEETVSGNEKTEKNHKKSGDKQVSKILYIVADRVLPGELEYFRENGVSVSQIFNSIEDASTALIMQVMPTRLVVIDTGNGRFTNMAARRQLIDMLGIGADAETDVSVFYTDTVIKAEVDNAEHVERDMIDWLKYRSTADVVANILIGSKKHNEVYVYDSEKADIEPDKKDPLNFKGLTGRFEYGMDLGSAAIDSRTIIEHLDDEETAVEGFRCNIKQMRRHSD